MADTHVLHISATQNHISLNSLGLPFAQLMEIERAAREAIRSELHPISDLYMDKQYFRSLKFKYGFEKNTEPNNVYQTKMMSTPSKYYYSSLENIVENLDADKEC